MHTIDTTTFYLSLIWSFNYGKKLNLAHQLLIVIILSLNLKINLILFVIDHMHASVLHAHFITFFINFC